MLASVLSLVWIVVLAAYGAGYFGLLGDMGQPRDAVFLEVAFFLLVLILPLAMVWLVSSIIKRSFEIQDEARRLEQQVRELHSKGGASGHARFTNPRVKDTRIESALLSVKELSERIKYLETQVISVHQTNSTIHEEPRVPTQTPVQHTEETRPPNTDTRPIVKPSASQANTSETHPIALDIHSDLEWSDVLRALNFPNDEADSEGFRTLRLAKRNPEIGPLLRASEDILNLLSQEGIYMEDMRPAIASAGVWRQFAHGERGDEVAAIGGIEAPDALERIRSRHDTDQVFRDTKLHFLRRFEIVLRAFADSADNTQIQQLADTRTGRAFMLLAVASNIL